MDAQQRNYIVERIKTEFNVATEPLKRKKKATIIYPDKDGVLVIIDRYIDGDKKGVSSVTYTSGGPSWSGSPSNPEGVSSMTFHFNGSQPEQVDYTDIIRRMSEEKNKVIDQIMLGDVPNATEILANFVAFLKTEKEKLNVN